MLDKTVVVISWPEPNFYGTKSYALQAEKYVQMSGTISNVSGTDGIANFINLTITGAMSPMGYLFFVADGAIIAPWHGKVKHYPFKEDNLIFTLPILLKLENIKLSFSNSPSTEVIEGTPFLSQPKIKVLRTMERI